MAHRLRVMVLVAAPSSHSLDKFTKPHRHGHRRIRHVPEAQSVQAGDAETTPSIGTELYASDCAGVLEWLAEGIAGACVPQSSHSIVRTGKHPAAIRTEYGIR